MLSANGFSDKHAAFAFFVLVQSPFGSLHLTLWDAVALNEIAFGATGPSRAGA